MGKPPTEKKESRDAQDRVLSALTHRALGRKRSSLPAPSDLDDDLLVRYLDGALSADERSALERRLVIDLDAKERLAILTGALDDSGWASTPPAEHEDVLSRAALAISRYVFHVAGGLVELLRGEGATALAPAPVRGTSPSVAPTGFQIDRLFHTAQGPLAARFELHAERSDPRPEPGQALVDLVVRVDADGQPVEGVRCKLLREGRAIDSREVEALGCTFTRLGPARYDVELRKGGVEIGRVLLDLRG
jgi:hypothetical protein